MEQNPYMQKLKAQLEQLKADWQKEKAKNNEERADQEIENALAEIETQFDAAGKLTEAKLKEWSAKVEQKIQETRLKFGSISSTIEEAGDKIIN
jgi:ElaB/YqjD/DUF883 family membrane-anchored ribosome-binding protein